MVPSTITFGTPSRTSCSCAMVPFECLVLYDQEGECVRRANHRYIAFTEDRDRGQLFKTIRLFGDMLQWRPHSQLYLKIDDDVCDLQVRVQQATPPCYLGKPSFARSPSEFRYAAGAAYGISNRVARRLQTDDLFVTLVKYGMSFRRLRTQPERLDMIHEDAFIGYFTRYRVNCNMTDTIRYRHAKGMNCTKAAEVVVTRSRRF